jgi:N-acetyl-anhydromuramyl-L-alanine amidase AmpD
MNAQMRPLMMAAVGVSLLGTGALLWLGRDLLAAPGTVAARPSLLELLEEVRNSRRKPPRQTRPAPSPPPHERWVSPIARACPVVTPQMVAHLNSERRRIESSITREPIHPTNYGDRFNQDAYGNAIDPTPNLIVLHETVYGIGSAINTFKTPHPRDEDQVSYHILIAENGQVVEVLDPIRRAFGAGNSAFNGEWVITNPEVGGSVNNFALHLSIETPIDGEDAEPSHSGYSDSQYDAAAIVIAQWMQRFRIPVERITTHRHIDLGGARADPRSFDWKKLHVRLAALGAVC